MALLLIIIAPNGHILANIAIVSQFSLAIDPSSKGLPGQLRFSKLFRKAQFALSRYGHFELWSNGGIEASAGCRGVLESGEMEPSQVIVEVFGGHATPGAQEGLDVFEQAVDGRDVQVAPHPLASRLVHYLVGDL